MAKPVEVTHLDMTVQCYGDWSEDSNVIIVGDDNDDGSEIELSWCGDGWDKKEPPANWEEVAIHLIEWAKRVNYTLYELTSC